MPASIHRHRKLSLALWASSVVSLVTLLLTPLVSAAPATFGNILPVRGHVADIALDQTRNLLYAANFTANRIEVLSLTGQVLQSPIAVAPQPSAVAVSPDGQFLVVGHYGAGSTSAFVGVSIVNLNSGSVQTVSLGTVSVLAAAFGNSSKALLVTTAGISLLDPVTAKLTSLQLTSFTSAPLPIPWATYPAGIIAGSAGVSGDGNVIYALVDVLAQTTYVQYNVALGTLLLAGTVSSPPIGPRVISVDQTGTSFLAGWALLSLPKNNLEIIAQFPYAPGVLFQGGHAFDWQNNLIYAQVAGGTIQTSGSGTSSGTAPLLQVFDSDNLTVRETFQLRENLAGKALLSGNYMYAISDSGLTIFPTGALSTVHRVKSVQEDLLFTSQNNGCIGGLISQYLDIVDPGGNATDFTLTSPSPGVTFSANSGTTPAHVQVFVNPTVFQNQKGTTVVPVQITSSLAVDIPAAVRVLINTKSPDQKGTVYDVPGTIVDVLADPVRNRFYVLRQDRNQVIVFDASAMAAIATLRTGNTPMQMAIYQDQLLVTNDNSQLINVFDLSTLTTLPPVYLTGVPCNTPANPSGPPTFCSYYARSIAAANNSIMVTSRTATPGPSQIITVDLPDRVATAVEATTFIYINTVDPNSALAASPSGASIFMTMPDGTVALYDTGLGLFVASRKDIGAVSGAFAALSDTVFLTGNNILGPSLVPLGQIDLQGGISSGAAFAAGNGLLTATPSGGVNGVIQRFSLDQLTTISPTRTAEAPNVASAITRTPLGQTGQTILPFTRTLAPLANGQFFIQLSTSGFTAIPWAFDAPSQGTSIAPPVISAVTNAADETPAVAPGALINIWGTGLSDGSPAAIANSCLYANSIPVPLLYVSPNQINAQLPFNLAGSTSLVLSNTNGTSAPFPLATLPNAPAVFRTADGTPDIVRSADGKLVTPATPIHMNDKLDIYVTGLGAVAPNAVAGIGAPSSPLAVTVTAPQVYIGPTQLFTLWAGLVPGLTGVYRISVQVPFQHVPTGSKIQFTVLQGNYQTTLPVPVTP